MWTLRRKQKLTLEYGAGKMGKISGKPGPDKKSKLDGVIIPKPFKRGGASGFPLVEITKKDTKDTKDWMNNHKA